MNSHALRTSFWASSRLLTKPQFSSIYSPAFACRAYSATPVGNGIFDALRHDHTELKSLYNKIINSSDLDEQVRYRNQFVWELARHSLGEEIVVYPAIEKHVTNGKVRAEKDRQQHLAVKETLYEFQKMTPNHPEFKQTLKALMDDLSQHIKEEENDDLPALESSIPDADSQAMAKSFERMKMFVPTRSHPSAPDHPPFETAVGLMTAPIDKIMDIFRKFPKA